MVKKLFILSFLLLSVLGCNNSALKPDVYSKETIDQKYPYWQVGIDRFEINSKKYTAITIDEKKYMLVCMALIRMAVNTDEFVERVKKLDAELGSSVEDSYNGQVLKVGDKYDAQKIIDCVRSLKYNFGYRKVEGVAVGTGVGPVGKSRYLRYGVQPDNEIPIGVVGLYSYNEYPNDAWLSWFGVLENYRQKGYGSKMFDFFEKLALNKGYTSIRVYTDNEFDKAILLYEKKEMIKEFYKNDLENEEINNGTIIYSKSLTKEKTEKWNNKFLGLTMQSEKEKQRK